MEKDSTIQFSEGYQELSPVVCVEKRKKLKLTLCLSFLALTILVLHSMYTNWCLKTDFEELQKKVTLLEMRAVVDEVDIQTLRKIRNLLNLHQDQREISEDESYPESDENLESSASREDEENLDNDDDLSDTFNFKKKREIRDFNESSIEKEYKINKTETETKYTLEKSSGERPSTEQSSLESSSKEKIYRTRKPHMHRKHRKSRIGSAERFFTETQATTSTPIQVRVSRTKPTQLHGVDKTLWLQNQKFQQHTSASKDTITKEEAFKKGYSRSLDDGSYDLETPKERGSDALSYNMITIHFSADTSHYNRERDPHYYGNGRMQIKSEVYKDWKPAHWTQGIGMTKYFHLHQGRVTVFTTGIYLIYAQIQYSNVQEVNGFSVFRNKEVVVQCITTSTHPDKHEIKSNTCGISTTILLQSNDTVCIKDLHHGRYVVLTPEKSYFGLVLLSPFKN